MRRPVREFARLLRHESTDAEARLWRHLRNRRLGGLKFRRQMPVGDYVVDFCCPERKVIVEVDGGQHSDRQDYDLRRTADLQRRGFRVLRVWNHEVFENLEGLLQAIAETVGIPSP
jgi:very-short-patch-repair endonuclease